MAKQVSNPNIAVVVDTSDVKPKVGDVNKALASLSGKPLEDLRKSGEKNFDAVNKDIKATVANLYRLRQEMGKGGDPSKIAKQLQGQLDKLTGGKGKPGVGARVAGIAGTADEIFGGKFDVGKGAKLGIAGIVGGLVSDTIADVTSNLVKAKENGGSFGDYTKAVGDSLPIIGGIVRTVENIDELWSGVRAEAAAYKEILEATSKVSENHNASLERGKKIAKETALAIAGQAQAFAASQRGGAAGRYATINADRDAQYRALDATRDSAVDGINKSREADLKPLQEKLAKATSPGQRSALEGAIALRNADADREIGEQNKAYAEQARLVEQISTARSLVAQGLVEDTKGVEDQLEALAKASRGLDADPFVAMRKAFLELKPSGENLAAFDMRLADHKRRLEEVEAAGRSISAAKNAKEIIRVGTSLAGLEGADLELQGLINAGLTDKALIAKVKVTLDAVAATNAAKALKDTLEGIGRNVATSFANTTAEKVRAAAIAEAKEKKLGPGATAELVRGRLDEAYAGQAQQTREAAKSPATKLAESIDDLKEQYSRGFIDSDTLAKAVGEARSGYADSLRTSRPDLVEAGSAEAQQMLAIGSGQVIDASNPELVVAREQKDLLAGILAEVKRKPVRTSLGA